MTINDSHHISQQFEDELQNIQTQFLAMGGQVEQQLADALIAFKRSDLELARSVLNADKKANDFEVEIDERCVQIIALRQPAASDLRLVTTILKAITDLERIGDEATNIARRAISSADKDFSKKQVQLLKQIGSHVRGLLHEALDAFARMDPEAALKVAQEASEINDEYEGLTRQMMTYMMEDPRTISVSLDILWAARSLERVADHARNLCEYVVYSVKGKDVRHTSFKKMEKVIRKN
jgi:phosphate transport system protein